MRNPSCHRRSCRAPGLGSGGAGRGGAQPEGPSRPGAHDRGFGAPRAPASEHPRAGRASGLSVSPSLEPCPAAGWVGSAHSLMVRWPGRARGLGEKLSPGLSTLASPLPGAQAALRTSLTPARRVDRGDSTLGRFSRRRWGRQSTWWRGAGSRPPCPVQVVLEGEVPAGEGPQPQDTFPNILARPPVAQPALPLGLFGFRGLSYYSFARSAMNPPPPVLALPCVAPGFGEHP